jgi:hypothetical protein
VFNPEDSEHDRFVPVWEWINRGPGRMIYGGTKYLTELGRLRNILGLVAELRRKGRVQVLPRVNVDTVAREVKEKVSNNAFNDEHLVAIVLVSRCHIVCTDDKRAMPYIKQTELYTAYKMKRPRIYSKKTHKELCCDRYVI